MLALLQEKRPLKRPRLGPPDVYPQEAKQKEDELTSMNVKHGFATMPQLSDEFGTAHNSNVNASKVCAFFNSILARKEELMTLPDSGRKKQQINVKDNFWPVSPRTKGALDAWFKDLAGNKPLISLAKKAPSFNKKEEIFAMLCDNQVSMQRAAWFIKLSSAYTVAVSEAKIKKRQIPDPATEWTGTLIKFMKDLIPKLQENYHQGKSFILPSTLPDVEGSNSEKSSSSLHSSSSHSNSIPPPMASPAAMHSPANSSSSGTNSCLPLSSSTSSQDESKTALRQWSYCTQLSKYMYEEALLERQEFLNWILELLDKMRTQPSEDGLQKLIVPFALQYMQDFVQSERLSRRLAYIVAKKLGHMLNTALDNQQSTLTTNAVANTSEIKQEISIKSELKDISMTGVSSNSDILMNVGNNNGEKDKISKLSPSQPQDPYEQILNEYTNCPHHRDLVLNLSAILQIITIECPTALVWCGIGENRSSSALTGSPLDYLPIAPSALPMPSRCEDTSSEIRKLLLRSEENIQIRSRHAENRWCAEKWRKANTNSYSKVLSILDALDSHCFDRVEANNSIELLYTKIFPPFNIIKQEITTNGETKEVKVEYDPNQDAETVKILCEWAVSCQRWGEHRAMAVAWLLDKRQTEVTTTDSDQYGGNGNGANNGNGGSGNDDKDSVGSGVGLIGGVPVFQSVLMNFLDYDAPVLDENGTTQNRIQFINLVHLFSELIRHDVFSHNAYLCTLISRGDLLTGSANSKQHSSGIGIGSVSNKPSSSSPTNHHHHHQGLVDDDVFPNGIDFKQNMEEFDDSNVDDDLDKLLQHIKEKDQQSAMDAPDSPKDPDGSGTNGHHGFNNNQTDSSISRHFIYTKHFPLPQDDSSSHESNQRYILLFGVGKERDEKKHAVKKMSKEICKLFSKKFSIDVAEGGKVKKHSRNEFNFESTTNKCKNMPYFDQHAVTYQCAVTVQEMLNSFALGNSNYLPVQEHVAFLFDLMEMALNIFGLLDVCNQILKELPEVESQLVAKKSNLVKSYTTSLGLYIIGILRRYNSCLLLSPEQTTSVFEGLCKVIKHVTNTGDCSSAEKCIIDYLKDLYSSCSLLKNNPQSVEFFHNANQKNNKQSQSPTAHSYNPQFMMEMLTAPRRGGKIEPSWGRQLNESPANLYSFVCNAIVAICRENDNDKLNDIAISCAELTASCNCLSAEWISALQALCVSTNDLRYQDLVGQINIQNMNVHASLVVFICILVARRCISLEDCLEQIAMPALANAFNGGQEITPDAEAGARLSCHLLLKLFKTIEIPQPGLYSVSTSPNPINSSHQHGSAFNIKLSCDRHLLAAAHKKIDFPIVLTVLKAILVVGDTTAQKSSSSSTSLGNFNNNGKRSGLNTPVHPGSTPKNMDRPVDLSHILGTSDINILGDGDDIMLDLHHNNGSNDQTSTSVTGSAGSSSSSTTTSSLSDFAQHVLKQICSQEWVLERCLQNSDKLCKWLIDDMLTSKQVQRLLHMICYPENEYIILSDMDQKSIIIRVLENLEQWTLRISWLDLQLMYDQTAPNQAELSNWLDLVARAAIDQFQIDNDSNNLMIQQQQQQLNTSTMKNDKPKPSIWLIAPLVSKLPSAVQGRILRVAGQVLESTNFFPKSSSRESLEEKDKNNGSFRKKPPLNNQPFLGLVLTCLKGQDEQKEGLLVSLHSQLSQFLACANELENVGGIEDPLGREEMLDALQLRFSLVGGMFEAIQKNGSFTTDWAMLLTQLVCQGVIDLTTNCELFTTVLDMLATLIHSTLVSDSQSERDENKKLYTNLMKKLKKEIGDKNNSSIKFIRQLLPLYKQTTEVISCEPGGVDTKGNKITGFDLDKKHGLRISDKQRVSVWDILEGHKNPAPLSWAWFGAVKLERKPLVYEETHRLLKYHTHSLVKPSSYFYEPLPLPPEDLEPLPEKPKDDMKADTPSSVDQSPSAVVSGRGRGKGVRKPRKPKSKTPPVVNPQQTPPQMQPQQMPNNQINQMQMQGMQVQNQISPNIQQYQQNMMQNTNQMVPQQQLQPQNTQGNIPQGMNQANQPQNNPMAGFVPGGPIQGMNQNPQQQQQQQQQQPQQQPQQQWPGYNQMQQQQQQQQQQQFYNQQNIQMNRFERPPINPSKQALSNMLRQRHPFMAGNQNNPAAAAAAFNMQQQQQQRQQQQQQQQQQQFMRNTLRGIAPGQMTGAQGNLAAAMNPGMGQMAQSTLGQGIGQMGPMNQAQQGAQGLINQSGGLINNNPGGGAMMPQQNPGMVQTSMATTGGLMQQQNVGMVNQNAQFQNFSGYGAQGMNQQGAQQNMIGGFNQMNPQRTTQAEYLAQQRALQANRGQYMNQAPNVTMSNMMGQGAAPPYPRQQATGGKPGVVPTQQQQQFQQQQRMRQQMMMQGMGGQAGGPGMGQTQNQGMGQQQTPALVAQLQRQMPNQQGMMSQQYSHQPPPY